MTCDRQRLCQYLVWIARRNLRITRVTFTMKIFNCGGFAGAWSASVALKILSSKKMT